MRRGTKVLWILVLALLIVANLALLFLLFRPDRALTAPPADQDPDDSGSATAASSPARDASMDPTPSTRAIESIPVERLLFAVSSKTAWRATVGNCETPSEIERSTNGGASWKRIVRTGPAPLVRLGAEPGGDLFTIGGAGRSCSVRYATYANDGTGRTSLTSPVNVWFPTPRDRDEINGPGGSKVTPCKGHAVGLAPLKPSRALVVCDNGDALTTRSSGKTWRQVARHPDTLAIAAGIDRYWLAATSKDCRGVTVQSLTEENGSLTRGPTRCAFGLDAAPGQVALDVTDDGTIWLWSGSRVVLSGDDGQTWK